MKLVCGTPENLRDEALRAFAATQGRRFILGAGCVTPKLQWHSS